MTDQPPGDLAALVASLVQQQTVLVQQQAALVQIHGESIRMQRLLVERLLGSPVADIATSSSQPEPTVRSGASPSTNAPPVTEPVGTPAAPAAPSAAAQRPETAVEPPPASSGAHGDSSPLVVEPGGGREVGGGGIENAAYAARYYRARAAPTHAPVQPQDLELMRRLHEMPQASGLILQFGPHKGNTLAQVAIRDPDYVRQLVMRAQRPEVRAAAGRLVDAIDAAAEHKRRTARAASRRSRATP
jgi:hypothetical protein